MENIKLKTIVVLRGRCKIIPIYSSNLP